MKSIIMISFFNINIIVMANEKTAASQKHSLSDALVITRVFSASREQVWKAWTDPEIFKRWWGPRNYTCPVSKNDLRVGGRYHTCMRSPEGKDYWSTGVYKEIDAPKKLVFTDSFADEKGNEVPSSYYGMPDMSDKLEVSITFEEQQGKTKMTLHHIGLGEMKELTSAGWNESFDKLEEIF